MFHINAIPERRATAPKAIDHLIARSQRTYVRKFMECSSRLLPSALCWRYREGTVAVSSQIAKYQLDDSTVVGFEVDPSVGWHQAGAKELVGHVRKAVTPAIEAARTVLEQAKEIAPSGIEVKFGIKVTGEANWVVARAATEGSFEVTLTWEPSSGPSADGAPA